MAVTTKRFDDIQIGDYIADMHDGVSQLRTRFGIVSRIDGEGNWFPDLPNKHLRVIGLSYGGLDLQFPEIAAQGHVALVCGYQYDGRRSGILVLTEYVKGPDPRD